jgi:hypothetical protein
MLAMTFKTALIPCMDALNFYRLAGRIHGHRYPYMATGGTPLKQGQQVFQIVHHKWFRDSKENVPKYQTPEGYISKVKEDA